MVVYSKVIQKLYFLFLGHFGEDYPRHTDTLTALVNKLETLSQSFDKDAKITLRNSKFFCDLTDTSEDSKLVHRRKSPKVDTVFSSLFSDASERQV